MQSGSFIQYLGEDKVHDCAKYDEGEGEDRVLCSNMVEHFKCNCKEAGSENI